MVLNIYDVIDQACLVGWLIGWLVGWLAGWLVFAEVANIGGLQDADGFDK